MKAHATTNLPTMIQELSGKKLIYIVKDDSMRSITGELRPPTQEEWDNNFVRSYGDTDVCGSILIATDEKSGRLFEAHSRYVESLYDIYKKGGPQSWGYDSTVEIC